MIPALFTPFLGWVRYLPYIVGVAMLAYGGYKLYNFGHDRGSRKAEQQLADYKETIRNERELEKIAFDEAIEATNRIEEAYDALRWKHEQTVQEKLAANRLAANLSVRLRLAYARDESSALSSPAESSPGADGAPGVGSGPDELRIDLAVQRVLTACRADSIKLQGFQSWWEDVSRPQ